MKKTYKIESTKQSENFTGTKTDAVIRANEINAELQPAFGVTVSDPAGNVVYDSQDQG